MRIYFRDKSQVIETDPVEDHTGAVVTTATVTATLTDESGNAAPGVTNPVSMLHDGNGIYVGVVPPIDMDDNTLINVEVRASLSDLIATSRETLVIKSRSFNKLPSR